MNEVKPYDNAMWLMGQICRPRWLKSWPDNNEVQLVLWNSTFTDEKSSMCSENMEIWASLQARDKQANSVC